MADSFEIERPQPNAEVESFARLTDLSLRSCSISSGNCPCNPRGCPQAEELEPIIKRLSAVEHHALLCTVCLMRREVAENCRDRADEIHRLLMNNCSFYASGARTCPTSEIVGLSRFP